MIYLQWLAFLVGGTDAQNATEAVKERTPNTWADEIERGESYQRIGRIKANQNHGLLIDPSVVVCIFFLFF